MKTTKETRTIRKNLRKFGMNDLCVDIKATVAQMNKAGLSVLGLKIEAGIVILARDVRLTQVCGTYKRFWVSARLGIEPPEGIMSTPSAVSVQCLELLVYHNEQPIGDITSDQQFRFHRGTVREALGWWIATDLGRNRELDVNLDELVKITGNAVMNNNDRFRKEVIVYNVTTRTADGHLYCQDVVYPIAYREYLGKEYQPILGLR